MWAEALRRDGIPAVIRSRATGALPSDAGGHYIMVLESDADQALAVLEEIGLEPGDRLR